MNALLSLNVYQKTFEHHKFEYDFHVSYADQKNTTRQWISSCLMKFSHHGTPVILKHIHWKSKSIRKLSPGIVDYKSL